MLYIHNEYLTLSNNEIFYQKISLQYKVKLLLHILLIKLFHRNVSYVVVQTKHMALKLNRLINREILIMPFFEEKIHLFDSAPKYFDFCYVGLPSKHKNHENLLLVIKNLLTKNYKFTIALTVPMSQDNQLLLSEIIYLNSLSPGCIMNYVLETEQHVQDTYSNSCYLI